MNWARAFALQARSDFDAYERLRVCRDLPKCHELHYLQMTLEKSAKAHLIARGSDPKLLQGSHAYIEKTVPLIVEDELRSTRGATPFWLKMAIRALARRVELLHPQVDGGGTVPANCEYPWEDSMQQVHVPAQHDFGLNLHREKAAITMIKAVRARVSELSESNEG